MWTQSVNGSGNAIEENLGRVKFTSYGHKGWDNGHTVLYSNVLEINNWNEITITGEWSFTLPKTAEMRIFLYDADNMSKYSGVTYATWTSYAHEHLRLYYSPGEYNKTLREIPNSYVDFKLVITKNEMQYWEDDVLIDSADTTTLSDSNRFKLMIGGWDHSSYTQYFYYDDISVSTDGGFVEAWDSDFKIARVRHYGTNQWDQQAKESSWDFYVESGDGSKSTTFTYSVEDGSSYLADNPIGTGRNTFSPVNWTVDSTEAAEIALNAIRDNEFPDFDAGFEAVLTADENSNPYWTIDYSSRKKDGNYDLSILLEYGDVQINARTGEIISISGYTG